MNFLFNTIQPNNWNSVKKNFFYKPQKRFFQKKHTIWIRSNYEIKKKTWIRIGFWYFNLILLVSKLAWDIKVGIFNKGIFNNIQAIQLTDIDLIKWFLD